MSPKRCDEVAVFLLQLKDGHLSRMITNENVPRVHIKSGSKELRICAVFQDRIPKSKMRIAGGKGLQIPREIPKNSLGRYRAEHHHNP